MFGEIFTSTLIIIEIQLITDVLQIGFCFVLQWLSFHMKQIHLCASAQTSPIILKMATVLRLHDAINSSIIHHLLKKITKTDNIESLVCQHFSESRA